MIIFAHVLLAVASLAYTTYLFVAPHKANFRAHYSLIALTVASGTYLVASTSTHMVETCMSGLAYLAIVTVGTVFARLRLARVTARIKD
ncbi:MAG TPA: hypothetical protein VLG11_02720 [Candidatus Saccharimonadales bacterium]|nr:hypothetical protein [Candidatus Saccharimonadales bacterium]